MTLKSYICRQIKTMRFKIYLYSRSGLIVLYLAFHSLALFVNVFEIKGEFNIQKQIFSSTGTYDCPSYVFTKGINGRSSSHFWPFVDFKKDADDIYVPMNGRSSVSIEKCEIFSGIFTDYDSSEFIAYTVLLFLLLYLHWNKNYS